MTFVNKKSENFYSKNNGFTLVELIVVITIIAILSTIAFISLQGYTKNSRDGARIADINNLQKSLEIYITEKGVYPLPDNGEQVTYSGGLAWTQGIVGDNMQINLKNISKKPLDPLTGNEYTYSVTAKMNEYQLGAIQEGNNIGYNLPIVSNAYASEKRGNILALIKGTYNEVMLKVSTGGVDYILAIPSIINSDLQDKDLLEIINKKLLVFNNKNNLPYSYLNKGYTMTGGFDFVPSLDNVVVYSGSLSALKSDSNEKKLFLDNLKQIYEGTIIQSEITYRDLLNTNTDNQTNVDLLTNKYLDNKTIITDNTNNTSGNTVTNLPFIKSLPDGVLYVKTDDNGNVYVGGDFYGTINFGSEVLNSYGDYDSFVAKYDASSNLVWVKNIGSVNEDSLKAFHVDNSGNVYLGGYFMGDFNAGGTQLTSNGQFDGFIVKYNTSGNVVWAKNVGGLQDDYPNAISVDKNGNVFAGGVYYSDTISFGATDLTLEGTNDCFVVKYNSSGNQLWAKKIGGDSEEKIETIVTDNNGNVFVGGYFYSSVLTLFTPHNSEGGTEGFIAKYDTGGNIIASTKIGGTDQDNVKSMTIDDSNNLYVMGESYSSSIIIGMNDYFNSNAKVAKFDYLLNSANAIVAPGVSESRYIIKFDNNLSSASWTKRLSSNISYYTNVVVDKLGNVFLGGYIYNNLTVGAFSISPSEYLNYDSFVLKLDNSGSEVYLKRLNSDLVASNVKFIGINKAKAVVALQYVQLLSIYIDKLGNIYTAGEISNNAKISVGSEVLQGEGSFVIKYNNNLE